MSSQINFRYLAMDFELTESQALRCFQELRRTIEYAIVHNFMEGSNARRAMAPPSSIFAILHPKGETAGTGNSNGRASNSTSGSSSARPANPGPNPGPSNANSVASAPSKVNTSNAGSSNAATSVTAQPVNQPSQGRTRTNQAPENARPAPATASHQSKTVSARNSQLNTGQASGVVKPSTKNSAGQVCIRTDPNPGPSNAGQPVNRPTQSNQAPVNTRTAPATTSQNITLPGIRSFDFPGIPSAGPGPVCSNTGPPSHNTVQTARASPMPGQPVFNHYNHYNQPNRSSQPNQTHTTPVFIDLSGLRCFLGRFDGSSTAPGPNTSFSVVGQLTGDFTIRSADSERPDDYENDNETKRMRVIRPEDAMDIDQAESRNTSAR